MPSQDATYWYDKGSTYGYVTIAQAAVTRRF